MCISRFRVRDKSMLPLFREGDYVISRPYFFGEPKKGDVVIVRHGGRDLLKRIAGIENGRYFVAGDNKKESLDSRVFGPVRRGEIIGKVWIRVNKQQGSYRLKKAVYSRYLNNYAYF